MSFKSHSVVRYAVGRLLPLRAAVLGSRKRLYGNEHGLRIVTLHETDAPQMEQLRYLVEYGRQHFDMVGPGDAIDLIEGRAASLRRDQLLFSFDDGFGDNYDAASYLASQGINGIFFVVPSFIGRSIAEYYSFHEQNGIQADANLSRSSNCPGLSRTQIKEMIAMGHLVAAHNYSHRDLGRLHQKSDLDYEIGRAIDELSEQLQEPCLDFAWGFGRARHLSEEAADYLVRRGVRIYSCTRGLNVAGVTPRVLGRDHVSWKFPNAFVRSVLAGGLDDRFAQERNSYDKISGGLPSPM